MMVAVILVALVACNDAAPTPIKVYVTATFPAQVAGVIPASPTPTSTIESAAPTETAPYEPSPTTEVALSPSPDTAGQGVPIAHTPTSTSTASPTVTPTSSVTATASVEIMTSTPTLTPTSTFTETWTPQPSLTPTPSPTNTLAPPSFPNVPPQDQLPVLQSGGMGIQLHPLVTDEQWTQLLVQVNELGFEWVKIQLSWKQLEPAPGQYSDLFYTYVRRVQWASFQVGSHKILLSVVGAPDWARPQGFDPALEGPPADPAALANFLTAFIRETKPEDNRIQAIEIWNEPNLIREWSGQEISGANYMRLFDAAYAAVKAVAPNITVVTAGLAPVCNVPDTVCDREFLRQMYAAGLAQYADVKIGVHPYGWANPPDSRCCTSERGWANDKVFYFLETISDYADIIRQNNHATKMWLTEMGWGTFKGVGPGGMDLPAPAVAGFFDLITPQQQAEYGIQAFALIQQPPLSDVVELGFLWNLNFAMIGDAVNAPQEQMGYSLLDATGYPRLIYRYFQVARKIPSS
ncbi:MAG: hypothetical protein D8M56_14460 [Chloroflexi bacterium]|nr:hypothetical protein [Chloroflexota bacterium]